MNMNTLSLIGLFTLSLCKAFVYVGNPMTFQDAQAHCQCHYGSTLATVQTNDLAQANADIMYSGSATWIGLASDDNGMFTWLNGDNCEYPSPGTCIDYWGTPQDGYGINVPLCVADGSGEKCAYYLEDTGLAYNDLDCEEERPFLCQEDNSAALSGDVPDLFTGHNNAVIETCCTPEIVNSCSIDSSITFKCSEDMILFDEPEVFRNTLLISSLPADAQILDVIVESRFDHDYVGDIQGILQRDVGQGQSILFGNDLNINSGGDCSADDVDITLSDDAVLGPADGVNCPANAPPAIAGIRRPMTVLSVFDGQDANGVYRFAIGDNFEDGAGKGTFGFWSLKLKLSNCPGDVGVSVAANSVSNNNDGFMSFIEGNGNDKYGFIEFVGLNVMVSILTCILIITIVYCMCYRSKNKSKGYGRIDNELNVNHEVEDESPIKDNL